MAAERRWPVQVRKVLVHRLVASLRPRPRLRAAVVVALANRRLRASALRKLKATPRAAAMATRSRVAQVSAHSVIPSRLMACRSGTINTAVVTANRVSVAPVSQAALVLLPAVTAIPSRNRRMEDSMRHRKVTLRKIRASNSHRPLSLP